MKKKWNIFDLYIYICIHFLQEVAVKELMATTGKLLRKTVSVPNIQHVSTGQKCLYMALGR